MDPVMLAWNLSAEEQNLELPSVEGETFTELAGSLCAGEGDLVLSGEKLTLPPFSVGVLKGK